MRNRSDYRHFDDVAAAWTQEFPDARLDHFVVGAALMRIGQVIQKDLFDQSQRLFGIGGTELGLLFALRRLGPPYAARPRTLHRALLITSGAVTKQIDRLEVKGLVRRTDDPDSLNGQIVSLTEEGQALSEVAVRHFAEHSIVCEAADLLPSDLVAGGERFVHALLDTFGAREETASGRRRKP